MLATYYQTSPEDGNETSPQSSCGTQPYWDNVEHQYASYTNTDAPPAIVGTGPDAQFNNAWGQVMPGSISEQGWGFDYNAMPQGRIQISRDPSPNGDYFGAVDTAALSASYPKAVWDPNDQPLYSPYSEMPPNLGGNPPGLSVNSMSPYNPTAPATNSSSSPPPPSLSTPTASSTKTKAKTSKSKSSSSKPKDPSTKSTSSSTSKPKTKSTKRKATTTTATTSSSTTTYQTSAMNPLPQEILRIATEHSRREALRIMQAEAIEMRQRRVQLLQHDSGALGREMAQLQQSLALMRQESAGNQGALEEVLGRTERLG